MTMSIELCSSNVLSHLPCCSFGFNMMNMLPAQENRLRTFVNYLNLEAEVKEGQSRIDAVRRSLHI